MSVDFNGTDQSLILPTTALPSLTAFTLLCRAKPDTDSGDLRIVSRATSGAEADHYIMVGTRLGTAMRSRIKVGSVTKTFVSPTSTIAVAGGWHFLAVTFEQGDFSSYVRLFRASESAALARVFDDSHDLGAVNTGGGVGTRIGANGDGSGFFNGQIADVRLYNRVLAGVGTDPGLLQTIFDANGRDNVTQGLIHQWRLDERPAGAVVGALDRVGGWTGTPGGAPAYTADPDGFGRPARAIWIFPPVAPSSDVSGVLAGTAPAVTANLTAALAVTASLSAAAQAAESELAANPAVSGPLTTAAQAAESALSANPVVSGPLTATHAPAESELAANPVVSGPLIAANSPASAGLSGALEVAATLAAAAEPMESALTGAVTTVGGVSGTLAASSAAVGAALSAALEISAALAASSAPAEAALTGNPQLFAALASVGAGAVSALTAGPTVAGPIGASAAATLASLTGAADSGVYAVLATASPPALASFTAGIAVAGQLAGSSPVARSQLEVASEIYAALLGAGPSAFSSLSAQNGLQNIGPLDPYSVRVVLTRARLRGVATIFKLRGAR